MYVCVYISLSSLTLRAHFWHAWFKRKCVSVQPHLVLVLEQGGCCYTSTEKRWGRAMPESWMPSPLPIVARKTASCIFEGVGGWVFLFCYCCYQVGGSCTEAALEPKCAHSTNINAYPSKRKVVNMIHYHCVLSNFQSGTIRVRKHVWANCWYSYATVSVACVSPSKMWNL